MTLETVLVRSDRIVGRRVGNEYVLVPLVGHGDELTSIYNLSTVGAFIWERLDGERDGSAIVGAITESFEVDTRTAEADYLSFAEKLSTIGAVEARRP